MKFWQSLSFTETSQLVPLARICEEVGFHGAFVSDHVFHPEKLESKYPYSPDGAPPFAPETEWPESFAAISAMATATRRLHFATAVYIATLRHPLLRPLWGSSVGAWSLTRRMQRAWLQFAREGSPEHDDLPEWPTYNLWRRSCMGLGSESTLRDDPHDTARDFWGRIIRDRVLPWRRP